LNFDVQEAGIKIAPLLRELHLGSDIAEEDKDLRTYFYETSAFKQVVSDDADLILGPKGCGKSAIFCMLRDGTYGIEELGDVDLIPAFNSQGSVFFQRLLASDFRAVNESLLRNTWKAYMISLIGNHIVDRYGEVANTELLRTSLEVAGLRAPEGRPRTVWDSVTAKLQALLSPESVEGSVDVVPPKASGKVVFRPASPETEAGPWSQESARADIATEWSTPGLDLESILEQEIDILEQLGRRCWVAFDRLDEAFQDSPQFEHVALRGLLRAHSDICSYGPRVRSKLFLRSDVLDRVTQQAGFVNVTHLRIFRIAWTEQTLRDMVVRRILTNETFVSSFQDLRQIPPGERLRRAILAKVLLPKFELSGERSESGLRWLLERTTDGTKGISPRNVLTFLRLARDKQLAICDVTDPDYNPNGALFSRQALTESWHELSRIRLADTLYAEFNSLRPHIERFEYGPQSMSESRIGSTVGLGAGTRELTELIKQLCYCGFMSRSSQQAYEIADLYRPALSLVPREGWSKRRRSGRGARGGPNAPGRGSSEPKAPGRTPPGPKTP
jgi:hypothetical protein